MKNLIAFFAFIASGIGQFLIIAVIIGLFLPKSLLGIYGFIIAIILVILFIAAIVNLFK
jgi:hypothetical protein